MLILKPRLCFEGSATPLLRLSTGERNGALIAICIENLHSRLEKKIHFQAILTLAITDSSSLTLDSSLVAKLLVQNASVPNWLSDYG